MSTSNKSIHEWTVSDVAEWLDENNLSKHKALLCDEHQIDGSALISLNESDLRKPPVEMTVLGDIKRITSAVDRLRAFNNAAMYNDFADGFSPKPGGGSGRKKRRKQRIMSFSDDEDNESLFTTDNPDGIDPRRVNPLEEEIKNALVSEYVRTAISAVYAFSVFLLAAFVLVVVHDRLPDTSNYPPLPDVVLETIPVIPSAFYWCEICGGILMSFWFLIIIFHKHRLVVFRRSCAISGTIFLLRCFTMYVTSMSVPGKHLQCSPTKYATFYNRAFRAFEIVSGGGMAMNGVRTCGDYMFSGHTATLTLLNFFVTEYTPRKWYVLHTFCWLLNAFGVFFILAAHEHYSIDVLIAFYISSRLFLYYHTLASTVQFRTSDQKRRRIWFPMFWFFEYGCRLVIPNEFEWPFTYRKLQDVFPSLRNDSSSGAGTPVKSSGGAGTPAKSGSTPGKKKKR
ncbi:sphingomyelin synthase-related protein 1-like isoform X1 [Clytia hemisphaerica]